MSNWLNNAGVFIGGIGGLLVGAAAAYQLASPPEVKTPSDLISALSKIEQAIQSSGFEIDATQEADVATALSNINSQVALAAQHEDGSFPFVPQSFEGVADQPIGQPYDLVFNGKSSLITLISLNSTKIAVNADGKRIGDFRRGENVSVNLGDAICIIELIDIDQRNSARIRARCS